MEYLGHIMGREGVRVDPKKIKAMQEWPRPRTLKNLHGFLGLAGYYMKFFHHYGKIAGPLINLLKKYFFSMDRHNKTTILIFKASHVYDTSLGYP